MLNSIYKIVITFALLTMMFTNIVNASEFKNENYYSKQICDKWGGKPTRLESGIYPDCETEFMVIEFDWAKRSKLYECIGQALVYAHETGKFPGCVLLSRNLEEFNFANTLPKKIGGVLLITVIVENE